jgi:hypothetical protein
MKVVSKKLTEEMWHTHPEDVDVKVKIRRFPLTSALFAPNDPDALAKLAWQRFNYSITKWHGFVDDDGNPLECNEDNKRTVFDHMEDVLLWVASLMKEQDKPDEKKNSKT